jgi:murein DD-endopeptidase MepM/ murein hydrolase activator NlpD
VVGGQLHGPPVHVAACVADPVPCPDATFPAREDSPYILRNVRQGNCNAANTHNGGESYAYDIEMAIGSDIIASRGGQVLAVIEEFTDDQHELDQGNVVAIDHGDRTYAKYGHITLAGSLVAVGDTVEQGQVIALSGDSGASQGPHVHFAVKECPPDAPIGSAACTSIPVAFRNTIPHPQGLIGSPTSQIGGGAWYPACAWIPAP